MPFLEIFAFFRNLWPFYKCLPILTFSRLQHSTKSLESKVYKIWNLTKTKRICNFDIFKIYVFHCDWSTFPDSMTAPSISAAPFRVSGLVATWTKIIYIIKQDIRIYVPYSRPNGWTDWAEIFCRHSRVAGGDHRLKKSNFIFLIENFFSTGNAGPFS